MKRIKTLYSKLLTPVVQSNWISEMGMAIPRILTGLMLSLSFGASKFGMPWTPEEQNLSLLEVAEWFPKDVAEFGGVFALAPVFFAWMAAASEAIGGLLIAIGFNTRLMSFLIMCTMLIAIFYQQWDNGMWGMLPALGFLWVAIYGLILGSGKLGLDYIITKNK